MSKRCVIKVERAEKNCTTDGLAYEPQRLDTILLFSVISLGSYAYFLWFITQF